MYNLVVSQAASESSQGSFTIDKRRFLEYTDELIARDLAGLSKDAVASIRSWPCLWMQEGRGEEPVTLAEITHLELSGADAKFTIRSIANDPPIINDTLWRIRDSLDIGDFEFSRNHWAIKDRDLFSVLAAAGYSIDSSATSRFALRPLPGPQRAELLAARDTISGWGHTEIDDLLLELGIPDITADRQVGSRRDRANAIVKYALEHPSGTTAENSLLSAFLVRRTRGPVPSGASVGADITSKPDAAEPLADVGLPAATGTTRAGNRVFVVHGRNEVAQQEVVSFLQSIGLEGIVLHEQPNMGRHLLTKFIEEAALVTFAVVLMTDDDVGSSRGGSLRPRARQNVILELGYFLAHLRQPRVCALITPDLETPSDFDGIVYIKMAGDGRWQTELKRELRAAALPVIEN